MLPHWVHLFNCGATQRWDALRVRRRIFEVLRFGTPIRAAHESRDSEKGNPAVALQLQLIERAPIGLARFFHRFVHFRSWRLIVRRGADAAAVAIAMRIGRQIEQEIFPNERCQIDRFRSAEFMMDREIRNLDRVHETFETGNAGQFDRLRERATGPERAFGNPEIERVSQRTGANDFVPLELGDWAILLAFQVEAVGWNLSQMNFHFPNFRAKAAATTAGTKAAISPPSRAISFTIRELK